MLSVRRVGTLLFLVLVLVLLLTACERPLRRETEQATADALAAEQAETEAVEQEAVAEEPVAGAAVEDSSGTGEAAAGEAEGDEAALEDESTGEAGEAAESAGEGTPDSPEEAAEALPEETGESESAETEEAVAEVEEPATGEPTTTGDEASPEGETTETGEASTDEQAAEEAMAADAATEEAGGGTPTIAESAPAAVEVSHLPQPQTHVVQAGENLYRIGLKYGMSWITLARFNNLPNPNAIYAGQILAIPPSEVPPPLPPVHLPDTATYFNHVVNPGENLFRIGMAYGISWIEIAEANGIINPNQIYAGQVLKIPSYAPGPRPTFTHVVRPGESLFRISLQYGVHWLAIAQANFIFSPYVIYSGQTLIIPGG